MKSIAYSIVASTALVMSFFAPLALDRGAAAVVFLVAVLSIKRAS